MVFIVILLSMIAVLFILAFISNKRFGVRALALAAGAMTASLWVGDLTPLIAQAGFALSTPPLESVVTAALTLLPALLVLSSGQSNKSAFQRMFGALLFAVLAITLLIEPIGAALVIEAPGDMVYDAIAQYRAVIVTVCLLIAVLDIATTKTPKIPSKH